MTERYDVAVVGAGLTGLVAAHFLAEGGASVVVLDRSRPGEGGATGRGAGLVLTGTGDHASRLAHGIGRGEAAAVWRFSAANGDVIRTLVEKHGIACGYEPCGSYLVAANPAEDADLREMARLLSDVGCDTDVLFREREVLETRPLAPRGSCALQNRLDAALDGAALLKGLAAALPAGVVLRENAPVRALRTSGERVQVEVDAAPASEAEVAIIATNARAAEVSPFLDGLVWPVRGQGFVTAPLPRLLDAGVSAAWGHELYRQLPDGRILAAGFRPEPAAADMGHDERTDDVFLGYLARFAAERIRGFPADPPIERRFAASCGFSRDGLPLLGPLPGNPTLLAACGYTMRGLSFGAAAGRAAARMVLEGVREFPACFLPGRFL